MTNEPASIPPSLPNYEKPGIPLPSHPKQQAPLMKMMGRMMAKRLPKMTKGKISSQTVKVNRRKKNNNVTYY